MLLRLWDNLQDWLAAAYFWLYCKFLQRPPGEPFTRQASRFEERWPAVAWGVLLLVVNLLARLAGRWLLITIAVNLFAWWFCPHIVRYRVAHPENVPYRLIDWAVRRLTRPRTRR